MGMFGSKQRSAAQQVAAGGDGVDPRTVPHGDPQNRLFGDGSLGGIASGVGKLLMFGPYTGVAQEGMNRRRVLEDSNMAYKSAMAAHAGDTAEPPIIRTLRAAGIDPTSPQGMKIIQQNLTQPHFMMMGSPETGQTVIDANNPPQGGGDIDPGAIARLKANPGEAALFDEHFGPGSAARILGGQ